MRFNELVFRHDAPFLVLHRLSAERHLYDGVQSHLAGSSVLANDSLFVSCVVMRFETGGSMLAHSYVRVDPTFPLFLDNGYASCGRDGRGELALVPLLFVAVTDL